MTTVYFVVQTTAVSDKVLRVHACDNVNIFCTSSGAPRAAITGLSCCRSDLCNLAAKSNSSFSAKILALSLLVAAGTKFIYT